MFKKNSSIISIMFVVSALAELVFRGSHRTGAYAPSGIPLVDGINDYFTMVNERDGGIGGVPVRVLECETGYTEKALSATNY